MRRRQRKKNLKKALGGRRLEERSLSELILQRPITELKVKRHLHPNELGILTDSNTFKIYHEVRV